MQTALEMHELIAFCSALPHCTDDPVYTDPTDTVLMGDSDSGHGYLGNAIEKNKKLHASLQRKQVEILALKERNTQLREFIDRAEYYAAVLDALTRQPQNSGLGPRPAAIRTSNAGTAQGRPAPSHPACSEPLLTHDTPEKEEKRASTGARRRLWPSGHQSNRLGEAPGNCLRKRAKTDDGTHSETAPVFGSFRDFHVLRATPSGWREDECVCFKASIREHGTVRTRAYPHGKTFTTHAADGACRFLWVPQHDTAPGESERCS